MSAHTSGHLVEAVAEVGSECYRRCAELEYALIELAACKAMEDRAEALHFAGLHSDLGDGWEAEYKRLRSEYIRRQPLAWDAARNAIAKATKEAPGMALEQVLAEYESAVRGGDTWGTRTGRRRIRALALAQGVQGEPQAVQVPEPDAFLFHINRPGRRMQYASVSDGERRDDISNDEWGTRIVQPLYAAPQPAPKTEAPSDTQMLDWMQFHGARVSWGNDGEVCKVRWCDRDGEYKTRLYNNWHEAIAAAMGGEALDERAPATAAPPERKARLLARLAERESMKPNVEAQGRGAASCADSPGATGSTL